VAFPRPEWTQRVVGAAAVSTALAACSVTTSFSGLTGGAVDVVDGGRESSAGSDAGLLPDGPGPEGGAPDGATPDGQTFFRCADHGSALFCADFDGEPFDHGFDPVPPTQGASVAPSTSLAASPPRSLLGKMPARTSSQPVAVAGLVRPILGARSFVLSLDLRIEESSAEDAVDVVSLSYHANYYGLYLRYRRNPSPNFALFEFANSPSVLNFIELAARPTLGAFVHVTITVEMGSASSLVSVAFDGVDAAVRAPISAYKYLSSPLFLELGITGGDGVGGPFEVRTDNVLVEAR
jgi:hypothetical protein